MMNALLDRLLPARLRRRKELNADDRTKLFVQVSDTNPALVAIIDLIEDQIEGNFSIASDPNNAPEKRLTAAERMGIACETLQQIEHERENAKRWQEQQNKFRKE